MYVIEVILRVTSFGFAHYLSDRVHAVDLLVSASSLIELIQIISGKIARDLHREQPFSNNKGTL